MYKRQRYIYSKKVLYIYYLILSQFSVVGIIPNVFEKIVSKYRYRGINYLFSPYQHDFVNGRSTITNLASFLSVAGPTAESRGSVHVVHLDFM